TCRHPAAEGGSRRIGPAQRRHAEASCRQRGAGGDPRKHRTRDRPRQADAGGGRSMSTPDCRARIDLGGRCGKRMRGRLKLSAAVVGLLLVVSLRLSVAFPLSGNETALPAGTELNEDALLRPREVFRSEAFGGRKSYLVNLGDLAFHSPT